MNKLNNIDFTFSDLIAGYVTGFNWAKELFTMKTSDGRAYEVRLTANTFAEMMRNLGEAYVDCTSQMRDLLAVGRFVYCYGVFFPEEKGVVFEGKHLVFLGREVNEFAFEKQDWWIRQVKQIGDYYLNAEFGNGPIDFKNYRTTISLEGEKIGNSLRQETDTISRLVYGFASAYLMTGDERYLEGAENGTKYLREHMRCLDTSENIVFWYHGIDVVGNHERKIFASEFGDDYDAIPAYEQIYALAGPTQTYRISGDPAILSDIDMTINLFDKYFDDKKLGGYFSHVDPVTFDPRAESLGRDSARKNWNSVGDHAPAYLINLCLATENERYKKMLKYTADTITEHFPDYENSDFVQEKFHEDWTKDQTWGWQQNRGVVGHNLKIAWNLTRINSAMGNKKYMEFAHKIAELMPKAGGDLQRGGWYDVVDRMLEKNEKFHRYAWHDRKAWWQQEQGILAYLILAGTTQSPEYLKIARESSAFYNTWFLDHDSGGIYFNVLANGIPYLLGTERLKGSHSMSGYHSFELTYLAAVYSNLLITKQHMDFYFKPFPNGFKDRKLFVAPDLLPVKSIKIEKVWIEGVEYSDFNAEELFVTLPNSTERLKVRVRIVPTTTHEHFSMNCFEKEGVSFLTLKGDLDHLAIASFRKNLQNIIEQKPKKLAFICHELNTIVSEGVRTIIFEKQKMDIDADVYIVGANTEIKGLFERFTLNEEVLLISNEKEIQ